MLENNTHVTGDNKGVAAYLFEQAMLDDANAAPGFVAGFSQANVGDTTPNVLGAWCDDGSGQMCSYENSTCADGKSESCHGRGPEFQKVDLGVSSCFEMGRRQYAGALDIYVGCSPNLGVLPSRLALRILLTCIRTPWRRPRRPSSARRSSHTTSIRT
jgi:neutral ceramidase